MPSFLKDISLRRRSANSFKNTESTPPSGNSSNDGDVDLTTSDPSQKRNKSSSTLSSWFDKSSTPTTPSSQRTANRSTGNLPALVSNGNGNATNGTKTPPLAPSNKPRPRLHSSHSSRYSIVGMPVQDGESAPRQTPATSPYAPRVLSVSDGSWVHQKVLLIHGHCAGPQYPVDGHLTIAHHGDHFPSTSWPVCDSHFKALVYLQPGPNRLRLDFTSPKLAAPGGQMQTHSSWININFLPLISSPPLQLCMLLANDSPETFDAVPERAAKEGNDLATALRKFRMAAYLWQSFTAEQMNRNGFGRRCYRYEEEWQPGTLSLKDHETGHMRNEAKIHIVRMEQTVEEIRDLEISQGKLIEYAAEAVRAYFGAKPGRPQYVSCMFLDTHWDKEAGAIRTHVAQSRSDDSIKLSIFGSHCLQSYPSHIEEVVPAFSDCTRTDTNFVANDRNRAGSNWEAVNMGIGYHLHENGHLFGCPHQESGIMQKDYMRLNRTFTCREPYSTRTKQQGQRLCQQKDECGWHRLDALRFRFHPCFQLPNDPTTTNVDSSVQVWSGDNGTVFVTAPTGVAWIELYPEGDDECHHWIEYFEEGSPPVSAPKHITLTEKDLREKLPEDKRKKKVFLKVFSCGGAQHEVKDFGSLASKENSVKLPDGRLAYRGSQLGLGEEESSQPVELILGSCEKPPRLLLSIRVYHGDAVDGLEFFYEGGHSELFGKRGGQPSDFALDRMMAETLMGFYVRAGIWIDAIQILTSTGRRSEVFGNATGGSGHNIIPPRGYTIAGVHGYCGGWLDGLGLLITR